MICCTRTFLMTQHKPSCLVRYVCYYVLLVLSVFKLGFANESEWPPNFRVTPPNLDSQTPGLPRGTLYPLRDACTRFGDGYVNPLSEPLNSAKSELPDQDFWHR